MIFGISILFHSCSKDNSTSSSSASSVNSGPYPTTTGTSTSPKTALNTQPTGCGTYHPMFADAWTTLSVNGSLTDTAHAKYVGRDTTIGGKKYAIGLNVTSSSLGGGANTSYGFTRRDGSKVYGYLATGFNVGYDLLYLDESKAIGDEWVGLSYTEKDTISGMVYETAMEIKVKLVKAYSSYTASGGLKFNDVIEVGMTTKTTVKLNGTVFSTASVDAGSIFYARCVGLIKTFTPKNPASGISKDMTQEIIRYKM